MKIKYDHTDFVKEVVFGQKLVGVKINQKRPTQIIIDLEEIIKYVQETNDILKVKKYLSTCIYPALAYPNGKVIIV